MSDEYFGHLLNQQGKHNTHECVMLPLYYKHHPLKALSSVKDLMEMYAEQATCAQTCIKELAKEISGPHHEDRGRPAPYHTNMSWHHTDNPSPTPMLPQLNLPLPLRYQKPQEFKTPRPDGHSQACTQQWKVQRMKRDEFNPAPPLLAKPQQWGTQAAEKMPVPATSEAAPTTTPAASSSMDGWGTGGSWGTSPEIIRHITEKPELAPEGIVGKDKEETENNICIWKWLACMGMMQSNREGFVDQALYLLCIGRYVSFLKETQYLIEPEQKATNYLGGYEADLTILRHLADCGFPLMGEWIGMATNLAVAWKPHLLISHDLLA
ncbi:hypothetical protein NEOLEDRAFT_1150810 [Neolentinus lepideus HHB14362 ss-1]|uniref:Uncharacterized protein n=1 Tax=Neolentinus lepideus HHB14362 ss-1 TaxID=1314782 RepID=A0A165PME3_9AGAM|nr:hypothetical protein NEOLEDRAFT_1150810 [Neolentinus lepideus HHB14362 ss-1]